MENSTSMQFTIFSTFNEHRKLYITCACFGEGGKVTLVTAMFMDREKKKKRDLEDVCDLERRKRDGR